MEDLLEDGEIIDSDSEDSSTKPSLSKPTDVSSTAFSQQRSQATGTSFPTGPSHTYRAVKCPGLSSSDEDSSDDEGYSPSCPQKRARCLAQSEGPTDVPFRNPLLANKGKNGSFPNYNDLPSFNAKQEKKSHTVWSSVLQEQTLSKTISSIGVESNEHYINSDRNVESYDYTKSRTDPRHTKPEVSYEDDMFGDSMQTKEEAVESDPEPQLCDVESFGLDMKPKPASAKLRLGKRMKDRRGSNHDKQEKGTTPRQPVHERLGISDQSSPSDMDEADDTKSEKSCPAKERLGSHKPAQGRKRTRHVAKGHRGNRDKSFRKNKKREHIKVTVDDPPDKVSKELMDVLEEPGYMEDLWMRIPEKLGNKLALDLLSMTEDVEQEGGLWINNGTRKRTPGGVYLFLLKEDKNITEEQKGYIFDWDKKEKNRVKKVLKKRAIRRKQEKLRDEVQDAKHALIDGEEDDSYLTDLKQFAERKKRFAADAKQTETAKEAAEMKDGEMEGQETNPGVEECDPIDDLDMSGDADIVLDLE